MVLGVNSRAAFGLWLTCGSNQFLTAMFNLKTSGERAHLQTGGIVLARILLW